VFSLLFAEADRTEAGCVEGLVHLSRCLRGSLAEDGICVEIFLYERGFSQANSVVHLCLLEDHIVPPLIKDKASN